MLYFYIWEYVFKRESQNSAENYLIYVEMHKKNIMTYFMHPFNKKKCHHCFIGTRGIVSPVSQLKV